MNPLIELALSRLTSNWQPLSAIKLHSAAGAQGFADLVWMGKAEVKRDPVVRCGISCGETTYFRLLP